ncbi:MAG: M20 family metallo-hydrolase [Saprospiraceae bacterium]|nr:M20 family metallo-hydrolase [Saprospiraceae bacterium]
MDNDIKTLSTETITLLQSLIATQSFSRAEDKTGDLIEQFLQKHGATPQRKKHNIWAKNRHFDPRKPVILLNSHHDTVRPNLGYTRDPFSADIVDGKLYGLGSNDAGGALTCLLATFLYFFDQQDLPFSLLYAASAEEEISGHDGIELILPEFGKVDFGIVGEPTQMQMAIAEKGLMVLDGTAHGRSGHAAREEGESALYIAMDDIAWIRSHQFPQTSELLGPVKMSVTVIKAGSQHNVVPDLCEFTVDVRVNECYTLEEVLAEMQGNVQSELKPRSLRMRSSIISPGHPLVKAGLALGRDYYGSPTTSDKALMPFPTLKMGPGDSARSHSADEFIYVSEIESGIEIYINLLKKLYETLG